MSDQGHIVRRIALQLLQLLFVRVVADDAEEEDKGR
jgi:hypothetical protein